MTPKQASTYLNLPSGSSAADVKKAYRDLALLRHPDHGGDVSEFVLLNQAYRALQADLARPLKCPDCRGTGSTSKTSGFNVIKSRCKACRGVGRLERRTP